MPKKLNKNAPDRVMTPEQLTQSVINAQVTQATAIMDLSDSVADIASILDSMLALQIRIAEINHPNCTFDDLKLDAELPENPDNLEHPDDE